MKQENCRQTKVEKFIVKHIMDMNEPNNLIGKWFKYMNR